MDLAEWAFLLVAGLAAGLINAVSSGGSFFTYPGLLLVGLSPIQAAATTLVALAPGNLAAIPEYRPEISRHRERYPRLVGVVVPGAAVGIALLFATGAVGFEALVPWLILVATVLFWFSPRLAGWVSTQAPALVDGAAGWVAVFVLSVYLTYFGSGVGHLYLALFTMRGFTDFHAANAAKNIVMSLGVLMAAVAYTAVGWVVWAAAVPVLVGSAVGGFATARVARRLPVNAIRVFVLLVGLTVAAWSFVR